PAHHLFGKVNKFLLHAPIWQPQKLITYWIDKILLKEADSQTGDPVVFTKEIDWLLQCLALGLRTIQDFELYRRSGIFERIMALCLSPVLSKDTRVLILTIVFQTISIAGAAEVLWMRCGVYSWLRMVKDMDKENQDLVETLIEHVEHNSNKDEIDAWKAGSKARDELLGKSIEAKQAGLRYRSAAIPAIEMGSV
ncbi:hypothetical protein LTR66_017389, partial [Elasticomyces elasticus]